MLAEKVAIEGEVKADRTSDPRAEQVAKYRIQCEQATAKLAVAESRIDTLQKALTVANTSKDGFSATRTAAGRGARARRDAERASSADLRHEQYLQRHEQYLQARQSRSPGAHSADDSEGLSDEEVRNDIRDRAKQAAIVTSSTYKAPVPFSIHPPRAMRFGELWCMQADSTLWRNDLRERCGGDVDVLIQKELPEQLSFVDEKLIIPFLSQWSHMNDLISVNVEDKDMVNKLMFRILSTTSPTTSLKGLAAPSTKAVREDDEMSEMGSMASDSLELVPAVPNYRAFPQTTENTPAYHYARKAYSCKSEDPTGQTMLARAIFLPTVVNQRAKSRHNADRKQGLTLQQDITKLIIPADLVSGKNQQQAYKTWRPYYVGVLRSLLRYGADWDVCCGNFSDRFGRVGSTDTSRGHPRLHGFFLAAILDKGLIEIPEVHAEGIIFHLDASFGSGTADPGASRASEWNKLVRRELTVDMQSLGDDMVRFFLRKKNDPNTTDNNVWSNEDDRQQLKEKFEILLAADVEDAERGQFLSSQFRRQWLKTSNQFERGKVECSAFDIREIVTNSLLFIEQHWMQDHRDGTTPTAPPTAPPTPHDSKRDQLSRKEKTAAAAAAAKAVRDEAEATKQAAIAAAGVSSGAEKRAAELEEVKRVAAEKERERMAGRGAHQQGRGGGKGRVGGAAPFAAMPPPKIYGSANKMGRPSFRNCEPPPGAPPPHLVKDSMNLTQWTEDLWRNSRVDFDRLKQAISDSGVKTPCYNAAAKISPKDSSRLEGDFSRPGTREDKRCFYCLYTPKPPEDKASPTHPENYKYGDGVGNHPASTCQPCKRVCAEGGLDPNEPPAVKAFIQSCLYEMSASQ